jgi:hypothetical protein
VITDPITLTFDGSWNWTLAHGRCNQVQYQAVRSVKGPFPFVRTRREDFLDDGRVQLFVIPQIGERNPLNDPFTAVLIFKLHVHSAGKYAVGCRVGVA